MLSINNKKLGIYISKRYYPGSTFRAIIQRVLPKSSTTNTLVLYNPQINRNLFYSTSMSYCKPFKFNNPYEYQHHDNILLCKDGSKMVYNPSTETFWHFINGNLTNTIKTSRNNIILPKQEQKIYSGLINVPPEYLTKGLLFQKEFDKIGILLYLKTLYILGKYNINNDSVLFEHIDKFFYSISELYEGMQYYHKWTEISMSLIQHILRAFFLDKKFPLELFINYMEGEMDFSQYKEGDILLLIECFIAKNTLKDLTQRISITAVNHEIPEEQRAGYSKLICNERTGQDNADFHGTQLFITDTNEIIRKNHYKDVKTYESGALKGRLALRPDLYTNTQQIREYMTKYQTAIQNILIKKQIKDKNHPVFNLHNDILKHQKLLYALLPIKDVNKFKTILTPEKHIEIKQLIDDFHQLLRDAIANPEISDEINLGISMDPGIDHDFINMVQSQLHIEKIFTKNEIKDTLFKSSFERKTHRALIHKLVEELPKEIQSSTRKSLDYIDSNT